MKLNLEKLSNKKLSFIWSDTLHETPVTVKLPNLKNLNFKVWGDWGPTYNFNLQASDPVRVTYGNHSYEIDHSSFSIDSPMFANVRQQFPLYIPVSDTTKGFTFHLYLDENFNLGKVEVLRSRDRALLFESDIGDISKKRHMKLA